MTTFKELGISESMIQGLSKSGIITPTDIQAAVLPAAIAHQDLIAQSVTGSGKTLAYLLPILEKIDISAKSLQAVILSPTHELSVQIGNEFKKHALNAGLPLQCQVLIGETSLKRQVEALKSKPHVIVGSPGRITELIAMKKLKMHEVKTVVLDEADRLLDDTKLADCKTVIKATLRDRQLMAFSASITPEAERLLTEMMKAPQVIRMTGTIINPNIVHLYIQCELRDKPDAVRRIASALKPEKILVFLNKNDQIQNMEKFLKHHQVSAKAIYGASERQDRKDAMEGFRSGRYQVLIASDLAARGLDIEGLNVVVSADVPKKTEEYLHRVGRTARYANDGYAIVLATSQDQSFLDQFEKDLNVTFSEKVLRFGRIEDAQ
jgi:superfamily II DNA/RNA helicase